MDRRDEAAYHLVQDALLPPEERIKALIASLPVLNKYSNGLDIEEPCPICLMPLSSVFEDGEKQSEERKIASCEEGADEQQDSELDGVTKLVGCGHIFCRRDLIEWIRSRHGSCPTCRHTFLDIRPPSESDDESSDGGEYIPNPDDFEDDFEDEDEDAFIDYDGFTDTDAEDFPVQAMELDFEDNWEDELSDSQADVDEGAIADAEMDEEEENGSSEWGLTDGESESMSSSEADLSMASIDAGEEMDRAETEVSVSVHEADDALNDAEKEEGLITHTSAAMDPQVPK